MEQSSSRFKKFLYNLAGGFFSFFLVLVPFCLGELALWYQAPAAWKMLLLVLWGVLGLSILWFLWVPRRRMQALAMLAVSFIVMVFWWTSIDARADRDWAPEVANIATGGIEGNTVTLSNVRNFRWRTEKDYDEVWETRTYNLDDIKTVDLFLSYWGMPAIAHTLIGFGFGNGDHVIFSVEIRKEKGEEFSNIAGFFKHFELALVAADERDIIFLRTNIRGEDVYRYTINMQDDVKKKLFLSYLEEGQKIAERPQFYNTVTANCTTVVFRMLHAINARLHVDPAVLLSGYLPDYLYKIGGIDRNGTIEEVRAKAAISEKGKAAGYSTDYSRKIRE